MKITTLAKIALAVLVMLIAFETIDSGTFAVESKALNILSDYANNTNILHKG